MKTPHQKRVEQFMKLAKQEVPSKLTIPSDEICRLRASLLFEECLEQIEALGCQIIAERTFEVGKKNTTVVTIGEPDLIECLDAICDVNVINTGTLLSFGLEGDELQKIVDDNNLEKFGEGHSWRSDGKLVKPPDHKAPPIQEYLDKLKA